MKKNYKHKIRKTHRYLGLVLGIQFFFWTIGGLYFSWNDLENVHGDHLLNEKQHLPGHLQLVSPQMILEALNKQEPVDSLYSLQLIELSSKPVYQIRYITGDISTNQNEHFLLKTKLANAETGAFISPLNEREAVEIARKRIKGLGTIEKIEYLSTVGSHHEYRGKPLPAWAVTFKDPANTTAYISAELGTFQSVRHNQWRIFDFLWMLHTMDYQSRDNFGNVLLKAFSIFGLFTILSGFVLFYISSPTISRLKKKKQVMS